MKIGLLLAPGPSAAGLTQRAESLGFDAAFFLDSPVVFGDPYVSMAVSAAQTSRMLLATGVTNPLTRSVPVTAAALASLNAIAPGRIALGIGAGYTANLAMGYRNASLEELRRYVVCIRQLLRGEVAEVRLPEREVLVQFLNPDGPWINLRDEIPVYMAAAGPKALRLAGSLADGIIMGGITNGDIIDVCRDYIAEGARDAGRDPATIELAITPSVYVTDRTPTLTELRTLLGPKSLSPALNFSRIAGSSATVSPALVADLAAVRHAFHAQSTQTIDPRRQHLETFRNYMTELQDWQYDLVTQNVLDATSIAGTAEECVEKIQALARRGIGTVILSPLPQYTDRTIDLYGRHIIPHLAQTERRSHD